MVVWWCGVVVLWCCGGVVVWGCGCGEEVFIVEAAHGGGTASRSSDGEPVG